MNKRRVVISVVVETEEPSNDKLIGSMKNAMVYTAAIKRASGGFTAEHIKNAGPDVKKELLCGCWHVVKVLERDEDNR